MPNTGKTIRREYSERIISVILTLYTKGYSAREISTENDVPKSTINVIIRRTINSPDRWYYREKRPRRPPTLNARGHRRLI